MNDEVKEGYKMTEIGEIPIEWEVKKLGEISDIIMGQSPKSSSYNDKGNGLPFFQGKTEFGKIHPDIKYWCNKPIKISEPNDVLLSVRAPVGDVNINNVRACIGRGLAAIRHTKYLHFKFLFYILKKYKQAFEKKAQGTTFTAINSCDIKKLKIPLPSFKEQQKIASILSAVDERIEQTDKLIEKTKELKKGLMQKLLTKGIGHTEFKKTEIGEIPVEWKVKKLGEIAEIIMGQSPQSSSYNDKGDGLPFFQGKTEFGEIYPNIKNWCNKPIKISEPDDILLSVRAPVGDVNINNVKSCIGRGLAAIRYTKYSNFKFLFYMLKQSKQQFQKKAQGSTFTAINSNDIKNLKIPLPPLKEQQKIASILSEVDNQIEQYELKKEKLETLKKGLMQQLLTGKKRVKVQ